MPMNIISLNTYAGTVFAPLMEFIERHAPDTDVFCFQEIMSAEQDGSAEDKNGVRINLLQELARRLPDFQVRFAPVQENFDTDPNVYGRSQFGLATFVRKTLPIIESSDFFLCNGYNTYVQDDYATLGHNALAVSMAVGGTELTVCNVHGFSEPGDKRDTPARLAQSQKIIDFLRAQKGKVIVMGDFNLLPDTESIRLFERAGYRNLIADYAITTTRGAKNKTLHPQYEHGEHGFQEFADYAFVSKDLAVCAFAVPDEPISDHLPMLLRCEP